MSVPFQSRKKKTQVGASLRDAKVNLKVSGDGAPADVDELRHVVVGVEGPDAALEVEVLVKLDALGLPHVGVELVRPVVTGTQGDAVVGHVVQETRLCGATVPRGRHSGSEHMKYMMIKDIEEN